MIYLASQSLRRHKILKDLAIPYKVVRSKYKETALTGYPPRKLVLVHALGKVCKALVPKTANLILGCDTIVYYKNQVLGKPKNEKEARQMLQMLSGRKHAVYSGIVLFDLQTGEIAKGYDKTDVYIKKLSEAQIEAYLHTTHPYDKAGGYAIQEKPKIVQRIIGSYTNVVGLPVELLIKLIKQFASF